MTILEQRLAGIRRQMRIVVVYRGLAVLFVLALGCLIAAGLLDWTLRLPSTVRAMLLAGTVSAASYLVWRILFQPLWGKTDDLSLALRVEERYPVLNDSLASTVQFLQQGPDPVRGDSSSLRRETMERAMRLAEGCNFNDVVDHRGVFMASFAALLVGGLGAFLLWSAPALSSTATVRFLDPYGAHSWTRLNMEASPRRVALGAPFVLRGQLAGIIPEQAGIEVQSLTDPERDGASDIEKKWVAIKKPDAKDPVARLEAALDMTQQRGKFRYRVLANDATYPPRGRWHEVEVVLPPRLTVLDGLPSPQCELRPPAYTGLPSPDKLSPGRTNIEAFAGTEVTLRGAVDRPIEKAWIEYRGATREGAAHALVAVTAQLGALAATNGIEHAAIVAGNHAGLGRIEAKLSDQGQKLSARFTPWLTGFYVLRLEDDEGLAGEYELTIRVQADPSPVVTLDRPASNEDVLADAVIGVKVKANDNLAVRSVYLEYRRQDAEGKWLDDEPIRVPLHDAEDSGEKRVEISQRWPLKGLANIGERIVLQACAEDFNNVVAFNQPGRSSEVALRIVSPRELAKKIDEDLGQIQQELVRVQQMQQEAIAQVERIKDDKDKPGFRPNEAIFEAEQKQRQIQARIGNTREEGIRAEIDKLKQLLKDNKLPPSDVQDRLNTLGAELDRIGREDLQQIEPNLAEARKELRKEKDTNKKGPKEKGPKEKGPKEKGPKDKAQSEQGPKEKGPKEKGPNEKGKDRTPPLDKAHQHQKNAQKGLDDLVKFMDPWAGMHQVKGTARKILDQQRDLKKATEKLDNQHQLAQDLADQIKDLNRKLQDSRADPKKEDPAKLKAQLEKLMALAKELEAKLQKETERTANAQNELSEKMEDLQSLMEKAEKKRAEDGDKATAKLLKDAADKADKGLIPHKMRQAKEALQNKQTKMAKTRQQESIDELEKVLAALEDRDDSRAEKLLKEQQKAEETIDKLRKKQDVLAKKTKEHKQEIDKLAKKQRDIKDKLETKLGDPDKLKAEANALQKEIDEHQRELAKLGDEQRKLKDEAQEKARELARLRADDASKALSKAGREMERAAKMIDDGEDPQEAQEQALERIEDAQAKLQEAEDELAREQLAKIADRLKGLKERQETATAESARLHKESVEKRKQWTEPLLQSLKGLAKTQKGLGQETDSLKDKLKNAKVFAHILDKSVKAMDDAADSLEKRFDKGNLRQEAFEKEELADELQMQETIQRQQGEAGRRLQRLLDALKDQKPQARRPKKDPEKKQGPKDPKEKEEDKGGLRGPGDGIPDMAQLKALRDEQQEVLDRTKDFAKRFPAWPMLDDNQKARLEEIQREFGNIQAEQTTIQRLFDEITARNARNENP